jgi:hypothetical protein
MHAHGINEMRTARGTMEQAKIKILVKTGDPGQAEDSSPPILIGSRFIRYPVTPAKPQSTD